MKIEIINLWAFCLILILGSSESVFSQNTKAVFFTGKIENATNRELDLYDISNNRIPIFLDREGRFIDTIQGPFDGYYRYVDAGNRVDLYFEEGTNLHMTYDVKDFRGTVKFAGSGAAANNYVLKKEQIRREFNQKYASDTAANPFRLGEAEFKETYSHLRETLRKELSTTEGLSDRFIRMESRNIDYEYLYYLSQYGPVRINHLNDPDYRVSSLITDEFTGFVATNEEDFQFSEMYRNIIQTIYYEKAAEIHAAEGTPRDVAYLEALSTIDNGSIRNQLLYRFAASNLNYSVDKERFYQAFMDGSSDDADKARVRQMYQSVMKVVPDAVSPQFINYENFAGGTTSLDDFKGGYVFIDIWATWCGPCVYEFPFLDEIETAYEGKNIHFVTLSVDTRPNRQKWRDFIKDRNLDGVQLIADNAFDSEFIKAYNITAIPRFLLIDPEGKIVDGNAPRPSDPALRRLLDSLPL